jgi:glutamyl-tRNA synthetase
MTKVITRFAPSPTGKLHIGNIRTAIMNYLYAKKHDGEFILRFDDTDLERSKIEYKDAIEKDLKFLGFTWDLSFTQSSRLDRYKVIKNILLQKKRLYPCFETQEELEIKRKLQLNKGLPPIYDRSSLQLSQDQINNYLNQGKKPHYRFLIEHADIKWHDMIKGEVKYNGSNLSDPVVIREDGSMTYMLCSVIDDIDYNITHIIRGEDHVTNTAVQIQMFESMAAVAPYFGHLSLVINKDEKISKRIGGFEIESLRNDRHLEPMAINSFFALIGSSNPIIPFKTLDNLIQEFDITKFSKSPTIYQPEELERLNHKLLINSDFNEVKERLNMVEADYVSEAFFYMVRPNLKTLHEIIDWWNICYTPSLASNLDKEFLQQTAKLLPEGDITSNTWDEWVQKISEVTGKKGKELFMPLRLAITGMSHGPELRNILPLIKRNELIKRLDR